MIKLFHMAAIALLGAAFVVGGAMAEGFKWSGGNFGEYWARLEGKLGLNVGGYVGHCAVRRMVMGDDASEREATEAEIDEMKALVRQSMEQGAVGFSTSQLDLHTSEDGRGVPSNFASPEEIVALCSVLAEFPHGVVEIIPRASRRLRAWQGRA